MSHYDIDGDGKVNFFSFITELLQLPHMGPREVLRGPRPPLSERVRGYMGRLRKELERAAARQVPTKPFQRCFNAVSTLF